MVSNVFFFLTYHLHFCILIFVFAILVELMVINLILKFAIKRLSTADTYIFDVIKLSSKTILCLYG